MRLRARPRLRDVGVPSGRRRSSPQYRSTVTLFALIAGCATRPPIAAAPPAPKDSAAVARSVSAMLVVRDDTDAKERLQRGLAAVLPRAGITVIERTKTPIWTLEVVVVNRARIDETVHEPVRATRPRTGFGLVGGSDDLPTADGADAPDGEPVDVGHDETRSTLQLDIAARLVDATSTKPLLHWTTTLRTPVDVAHAGAAWDAVYRFAAEQIAQRAAHILRQAAH